MLEKQGHFNAVVNSINSNATTKLCALCLDNLVPHSRLVSWEHTLPATTIQNSLNRLNRFQQFTDYIVRQALQDVPDEELAKTSIE